MNEPKAEIGAAMSNSSGVLSNLETIAQGLKDLKLRLEESLSIVSIRNISPNVEEEMKESELPEFFNSCRSSTNSIKELISSCHKLVDELRL